ncbi:sodium:solute symporter family protein [Lentzea sp. BCCO 10_0856]|uniref:Sodium:solute symporter family protein n=1 Tax=Lentzea miocenica TaxID=3095431 RepID=A0ABU4SVG5_9PSEU|nr:sodium:solute symporter family protein [Lentzea sp. BCCO 10_0856]MDX8029899.1 sodium:solute symporter family protein [Lentzea sp. BCCO 10_0856]
MGTLDWIVVAGYFVVMVGIGLWSRGRIKNIADFFTAGGKMPWWLSGISHHMSGYSAVMFVAFAAEAYRLGLTVYIWWSLTIGIGVGIGAFLWAPAWNRLRAKHDVKSPLEYLAIRYNVPTQQLMAWAGAGLKVVDIAAKWVAVALLLQGFAGVPIFWGIALVGVVTMVYSVLGGLWADALTDFGQFIIQGAAGLAMFFAVASHFGGINFMWTIWDKLPESHSDPLTGPYTLTFFMALFLIKTLEYNGGMWNLAQRYMAAPSGFAAKRSALLSAGLWLVWPLILFFPMWAAPLIVPGMDANAEQAYVEMGKAMLPAGMVGLVLAGFFSHTMAMVSSDANVITAVITRDILPRIWKGARAMTADAQLKLARITTFLFIGLSMTIALTADTKGFVLKVVIALVAATMGPIAIPLMLGLLPWFRKFGPTAALSSTIGGLSTWIFLYVEQQFLKDFVVSQALIVSTPLLVSLVLYLAIGFAKPEASPERDALIDSLKSDEPDVATVKA